jgi:hypothetical protein
LNKRVVCAPAACNPEGGVGQPSKEWTRRAAFVQQRLR